MKIHRLYTDKNGESHFQDVEVEYAETTRAGRLSKRIPATGIIFREVQPDYDLDWHPAPRRQYIINLDAGVQITATSRARCATASSSRWSKGRGRSGQPVASRTRLAIRLTLSSVKGFSSWGAPVCSRNARVLGLRTSPVTKTKRRTRCGSRRSSSR